MSIRHLIRSLASNPPMQALFTAGMLAALVVSVPAQTPLQFEELPRHELPFNTESTWAVALGDVDGDGDLDMVFGNRPGQHPSGQNRLYLNDGTGAFTDVTATQMPVDNDLTLAVALGDVDGDGDLDMVIGNSGNPGQQNRLYLNDGSGTYTDVTATHMPVANDYTPSVVLGDVDGDGDLDIVASGRLYLNDGTGAFTDVTATQMPVAVGYYAALGDVDGDGDLDVVFGTNGQNTLCLNDGLGVFTDVTATRMPVDNDRTWGVALGDVDGDGDLDMIAWNMRLALGTGSGGLQDRLYLNDGIGAFTDVTATQMPPVSNFTAGGALGDVDGDGDLDMVFVGYAGDGGGGVEGYKFLYLNNGSGTFVDATARMTYGHYADGSRAVALGDVDGDADLDLVVGLIAPGYDVCDQNCLFFNLQRQLYAPVELRVGQPYTLDAYLRYGPPVPITFALPYVSFAPASIALPPFGTLGIDPAQAVALPPIQIPQPLGVGSLSIAIVNDPGLLGLSIYSQALLVPYPFQARLSNVVPDRLIQ